MPMTIKIFPNLEFPTSTFFVKTPLLRHPSSSAGFFSSRTACAGRQRKSRVLDEMEYAIFNGRLRTSFSGQVHRGAVVLFSLKPVHQSSKFELK